MKKNTIILFLLALTLVLTACTSGKDGGVEMDEKKATSVSTGQNWCPAGTKSTTEGYETNIFGMEVVKVNDKDCEGCHSRQVAGEGEFVSTLDVWKSQDDSCILTKMKIGDKETVTENWVENGKRCMKITNGNTGEVEAQQCN